MKTVRIAKHLFLLFFHLSIVLSVSAQKNYTSCGVVNYTYKFYDSASQTYLEQMVRPTKMWYRDSLIIEMVTSLSGDEDEITRTDTEMVVKNYAFIDLKTGTIVDYFHFSPSALVKQKFNLAEGPEFLTGRGAYDPARKVSGVTMTGKLPDTIINGIMHKRISSYYVSPETQDRYNFEEFFRCDIKTSIFDLDREASKTIGCPCVRVDVVPRNPFSASREIEFVSNELTTEESAVFDAWSIKSVDKLK